MAGSVNKVIIVGNLGADPEVKSFQNGGKICNLRVATSESWNDRATGEKKEKTQWHQVVIKSEGLAGVAERFLRKGSKVYLEGQIETRKWQDNSGNDRYSTEVVLSGPRAVMTMLDGAKSAGGGDSWGGNSGGGQSGGYNQQSGGGNQGGQSGGWGQTSGSSGGSSGGGFDDDLDDDVPF